MRTEREIRKRMNELQETKVQSEYFKGLAQGQWEALMWVLSTPKLIRAGYSVGPYGVSDLC
jgi:hypothetical protein